MSETAKETWIIIILIIAVCKTIFFKEEAEEAVPRRSKNNYLGLFWAARGSGVILLTTNIITFSCPFLFFGRRFVFFDMLSQRVYWYRSPSHSRDSWRTEYIFVCFAVSLVSPTAFLVPSVWHPEDLTIFYLLFVFWLLERIAMRVGGLVMWVTARQRMCHARPGTEKGAGESKLIFPFFSFFSFFLFFFCW
eukprot:gene2310-1447_t